MSSPVRTFLAGCLSAALVLAACGPKSADRPSPGGERRLSIAVIPKGTTHEFWKSIRAGAEQAGREAGVETIWKGPQKEDDRSQQITVVEDFISRGVDGIVLAPLDDRALMRPVRDAVREGIPVVVIDSGLQGDDYVSYVATDNYRGGVLAAHRLGGLLGGRGRIFLIRYQEGSASTMLREAGFLDTVRKEFPDLVLLVQDQYAGATTETAFQLAENLISRFPDVEGVFAPNESSTFGALRALQSSGLAGRVKFVGFDSSPKLIQGLRDGHLHGLVLQNPMKMGYLGVKTIVAHLRGEQIPKVIDTGVTVATAENMDDPEIKSLLEPDLATIPR
ncbi:MAG: substrate-binding domain-containing protein [Candidatus Aminicenantes bacterium]|nr:substrate-binding domain-containing protein [Candidatus Aminicenantes bacterium]